MSAEEAEDPHPDPRPEIPIEYDPEFGKIADESDLAEPWRELARLNVNDEAELRADRIAELRELLEESGIVLQPGDDCQMLMFLRAANCEPKKAIDVVRHFLEYRKYIAKPLPSELRDLMEATKDLYCVLPHRDKVGWSCTPNLAGGARASSQDLICLFFSTVAVSSGSSCGIRRKQNTTT